MSTTSDPDPVMSSRPVASAGTAAGSAAAAIESAIESRVDGQLLSVLERDFLVPAAWVTVVDAARGHVEVDGRRFRLDSPYSDGQPCLRLLDDAGRRNWEMATATTPGQLAAILRSPAPAPVSMGREAVRSVVAAITVVACLWYATSLLADVWGTDRTASTWQLLVIPLILLPNYLVQESAIATVRRASRWVRTRLRRTPTLDRTVGEGAAADADREVQ